MTACGRIFCALLLWWLAAPAQAGSVAFSNLLSDESHEAAGNWLGTLGAQKGRLAASFVAERSGRLDELWLALSRVTGSNSVALKLFADVDGAMAEDPLWSTVAADQLGAPGSLLRLSGLEGVRLEAGRRYWLVGEAPDDGLTQLIWNRSGTDSANGYALNYWDAWLYLDNARNFALQVGVTPVPLPGSLLLWLSGLGGLACLRRIGQA